MKVLYLGRNDGTDVRVAKVCNSLHSLGHEVTFLGWDRNSDPSKQIILDPSIKRQLFIHPAGFGILSSDGWIRFYMYIVKVLLEVQPDVVHCLNEYPVVMILPFKQILYKHVVLDIFDSLATQRFSSPLLRAGAWVIRKISYRGSDAIIETSEHRQRMLGQFARKSIVIMNVPPDPGPGLALNYPTDSAVQVCVGGSLVKQRGLDVLLKAVDQLPQGLVQIQASGWLYDDFAREVFVTHPAVTYHGLVTPGRFLELMSKCDAVCVLYDPQTEYACWMSPNKIFDAMSVGRPVIVAQELKISQWVMQQRLGFACGYHDVVGLASILLSLKDYRAQLRVFAKRARQLFTGQYSWSKMEDRLRRLYDSLASGAKSFDRDNELT